MKLENNCVIFKDSGGHWTFHVNDVEFLYHYVYSKNARLEDRIIFYRKGSSSNYEFTLPGKTSLQEISQFIDSVYKARKDFNSSPTPIPIN